MYTIKIYALSQNISNKKKWDSGRHFVCGALPCGPGINPSISEEEIEQTKP